MTEPNTETVFKPNTLIQYKGGGYDGCFWEYNYAFIDEDGNFHDVFSSGYRGCKTFEKLQHLYAGEPNEFQFTDMTSEQERDTFADQEAVPAVVGIAKWFEKNGIDFTFAPKCDCCGERFAATEGHGDKYKCVGGIEIVAQKVVCSTCHEAHSCSNCNEYYGPDHTFSSTKHYSHACEYCTEKDGGAE
jgi:hypothetical protein